MGMDTKLTTLYRPTGQKELDLVAESGYRRWPPRLPEQPIFYPVTNEDYAVRIARDWNTKDAQSDYVGYVTRFNVDSEYLAQFPIETVGDSSHTEYWIPAARLEEFNDRIHGKIEVIHTFNAA